METPHLSSPARLTALYMIAAMLWIVGSDLVLAAWDGHGLEVALRQSGKGAIFVVVSGLVLWFGASRMLRRHRVVSDTLLQERAAASALLARKERLQATIARANQAALDVDDPDRLCQEICDALVHTAGMRCAWVGWEDPGTRRIVPAQRTGESAAALDQLPLSTAASEPGSGSPAGRAICRGAAQVSQDFLIDPAVEGWRALLLEHGWRSCAAVPIANGRGRRGVVTVYAAVPQAFDQDIVSMLEQLGTDLRRGLEVIAVRNEMRRKTESLRVSEERWQFALEGAGDGVWDWSIDSGQVFLSRRLLEMLGYESHEANSTTAEWEDRIHPEDRSRVIETMQRYLSGETPLFVCEHRLRTKRGEYRWILGRGKLFEGTGPDRLTRLIGTYSDITARKETERELHLLRSALESAPVGVMITDRDGTIKWVNPAFMAMSGYGFAEVVGRNPRLLRSGRQDTAAYAQLWATILRGENWQGELINRRKDGTDYPEAMTIAAVRDEAGRVEHFVAVKQDVTERRQLEQQFLRAQRLEGIGQLASGITHDLNNVLAPILLSVELLKLKNTDPATRASLDVIDAAARRGAGIVRQVLTFARGVDGESIPLRPKDIVRELSSILDETFPRQIRIERSVADDLPFIAGDATQMHQLLLNLAINARDVMEQGGTLRLTVTAEQVTAPRPTIAGAMPPGSYVAFRVSDTGPGIAPEVLVRMFEPFFTTKPKGKGTGLGLATTLGIVRSHHGFIEVETSPRGTEFLVYLPAIPAPAAPVETPGETTELAGDGRLLLVCDDEPSIRDLTVAIFSSRGFRVVVASDGIESLSLFAQHCDELAAVVLDLMMPGCTGAEVLAQIRRERTDLPVLLASGLMSEAITAEELARETARGPTGMIQKPYTAPALLEALGKLLPAPGKTEPAS